MYKKAELALTERGMTVKGNSAYGIVQGYETNAAFTLYSSSYNNGFFKTHITLYASEEEKREILCKLEGLNEKYFDTTATPYGILFSLGGTTIFSFLKRLGDVFDKVFEVIVASGAKGYGYCPICGKEIGTEDSLKHNVDGFVLSIDDECLAKVNNLISEENKCFESLPNNYHKGILGALIGGIVGGLVAFLIAQIGYIAAISSIVAILLGSFLYQKFGGKPTKGMIAIVAVVSLVCMLASDLIVYTVAAGAAAKEADVAMSGFEALLYLLGESKEFATGFYLDLLYTFLFSLLGIGLEIGNLNRKIKRQKNIR